LNIKVEVTDSRKTAKTFNVDVLTARKIDDLARQKVISITNVKPNYWLGQVGDNLYSVLSPVETYGVEQGLPKYQRIINPDANSTNPPVVEILDPAVPGTGNAKAIPMTGLNKVLQVMRIDINRNGQMEWLVVGKYNADQNHSYVQFRFFNSDFQPLWGSADNSTWQIQLTGSTGALIENHSFAKPGSWLLYKNQLIPAFKESGSLPEADNYSSLDIRYFQGSPHFYYLSQQAVCNNTGPILLEAHAVDSKTFRKPYSEFNIQNLVPASDADMKAGHVRILVEMGHDVNAPIRILDLSALESVKLLDPTQWSATATGGSYFDISTPDRVGQEKGYFNLVENQRGTLTWLSSVGQFLGRSNFAFQSNSNPIVVPGLLGAFDLPSIGRVWFVQSQFDLVAYHQSTQAFSSASDPDMSVTPIDRDSTMASDQFGLQFKPVIVGADAKPLPGMYIDLTKVRGNVLSIVTWNSERTRLEKTARYSFMVPANCAQMPPVQFDNHIASFAIPMICQNGSQLEYQLVQP